MKLARFVEPKGITVDNLEALMKIVDIYDKVSFVYDGNIYLMEKNVVELPENLFCKECGKNFKTGRSGFCFECQREKERQRTKSYQLKKLKKEVK